MHIIYSNLKGILIFNFYSYSYDEILSTYEYTGDGFGDGEIEDKKLIFEEK